MPLLSFGEIEVNSDALPLAMKGNCKENGDVDEPITIEELFNEEYVDTISEPNYVEDLMGVPEGLSRHVIIEDEVVIMEDQVRWSQF